MAKKQDPYTFLCICLAIVSFLVYANTLQNGYVMDDAMVIQENTIVSKGITAIPQLLASPRFYGYMNIANDQYRPVSLCMFAIEYQLFGANPFVGHFLNILVFAGCVVVLFLFLTRLTDNSNRVIAFIAAVLFAVHPIHTEVVANIKSRDELLCYLFAFSSLNLFWIYAKQGRVTHLVSGCSALFLAFLSKETVITFLAIIPLIFIFYCNENRRRSVFIMGGSIFVTGMFLFIRMQVLNKYHSDTANSTMEFVVNALIHPPSKASGIATEFLVMGKYLQLLIVPYPLICNYSYNSIPFAGFGDISVLVSIIAYGFLLFVSISRLLKNKKDLFAFGILFYLITLSLFSNFFFLIGSQMAERFEFFSSTGFCLVVALLIGRLLKNNEQSVFRALNNEKVLILLIPVFLIFSGITIARNMDWRSNYLLFKADLPKSPDDIRLIYYYAKASMQNSLEEDDATCRQNIVSESIGYLNHALAIYPGFAEAHTGLGNIYDKTKQYDSSEIHYLQALAIQPVNSIAAYNLGWIYYAEKKYNKAIQMFKKTIFLDPGYELAYMNLARCCLDIKQYDTAIVYFSEILSKDPDVLLAQQGIALAYFETQNFDSAASHYKLIIDLKPGDPDELNNLGVTYLNAKKYLQAIDVFGKLITANPSYATAYNNLGTAYYYTQQYNYAIEYFGKAIKFNPQDTTLIPLIVKSYLESGKKDSAKIYKSMLRRVR